MSKKAEVINLERSDDKKVSEKELKLDSGRQVLVRSDGKEEHLHIIEREGEVVLTVRLTDHGPIISVQGAHLELKSSETLALEAKKIEIKAEEEAVVKSKGKLEIGSSQRMDLHSEDDIRVVGKMIHLN